MVWILAAAVVIPSLVVSYFAVAFVKRAAHRLGLLDHPNARKVHVTPIPLGGGLGIWCGMLATFAVGTAAIFLISESTYQAWGLDVLATHSAGMKRKAAELWGLLGCAFVLVITGLLDDRRGLAWQLRLIVEFVVAAVVVFGLGIRLTAFIPIPYVSDAASVVWIVALINSFNMLDNMDGLSGGVAAIIASILAIMLLTTSDKVGLQPQIFVAVMLLVLLGGLIGFLFHNWPPATIFMGDAGSYLVGFWIAVATLLTTYTGYHSSKPQAVFAPLCALAIPLYDTLSVVLIRLREGRSPFQADKRHFSHRLVELGLTKPQAVFTIYLATLTTSLSAILLQHTDIFGAGIVLLIVLCTCGLITILEVLAGRDRQP